MVREHSKDIIKNIFSYNDKLTPTEIERKCQEQKDPENRLSKGTIYKVLKELVNENFLIKNVNGKNVYYTVIDKKERLKRQIIEKMNKSEHKKVSLELQERAIEAYVLGYLEDSLDYVLNELEIHEDNEFIKPIIENIMQYSMKNFIKSFGFNILYTSEEESNFTLKNFFEIDDDKIGLDQIFFILKIIAIALNLAAHYNLQNKENFGKSYQIIFQFTPQHITEDKNEIDNLMLNIFAKYLINEGLLQKDFTPLDLMNSMEKLPDTSKNALPILRKITTNYKKLEGLIQRMTFSPIAGYPDPIYEDIKKGLSLLDKRIKKSEK